MGMEDNIIKQNISNLETNKDITSLEEMKKEIEAAIARINAKTEELTQPVETTENQINLVTSLEGSNDVVVERTAEIDKEIGQKDEEIIAVKNEVENQLKNIETNQPKPEATNYKSFDKKTSLSFTPEGSSFNTGSRFSVDEQTGQLLPGEATLRDAGINKDLLEKVFDFKNINADELSDRLSTVEDLGTLGELTLIPAVVDASGNIVSKGEIIIGQPIESTKKVQSDIIETQEIKKEGISYQEYEKKFQYFDLGDKTTFGSYEGENAFSYNDQTNEVLPLKEGWRLAKSNPSYFLDKAFNGDWSKIADTPIEDLKFIPAKLDRYGKVIQKGEVFL